MQLYQDLLRVLEASRLFVHVSDRVQLDIIICCVLFHNVQELQVRSVCAN